MQPTLEYLPTRSQIWRRVLIRQFRVPVTRWVRLAIGPALAGSGALLIFVGTSLDSGPLGLFGGSMAGIGLAWTLWPLLGAWIATTRSAQVVQRTPIRITIVGRSLEVTRGIDRQLFPIEHLELERTFAGESWLRFRGERWVVVPSSRGKAEVGALLAAIRSLPPGDATAPT